MHANKILFVSLFSLAFFITVVKLSIIKKQKVSHQRALCLPRTTHHGTLVT